MKNKQYPSIDIIIPTLNAALPLKDCLSSIQKQIYPKSKINIIISDGGSTDDTLKLAKKYKAIVIKNELKTAEAGKAIAIKHSKSDLIALIDSDNILPTRNWLQKMVLPFNNEDIIGTEPYKFTYRNNSGIVEKYSALIGANDPYAFVSKVYDRYSYISNKWTGLAIQYIQTKNYFKLTLNSNEQLPTIGANGTIFRSNFIKQNFNSNYFFDIDLITSVLSKTKKPLYFAKVKVGIIHTYCENSIKKFIRKQNRRVIDYYIYSKQRTYNWSSNKNKSQINFALYTILIIPSLVDSIKGFIRKPNLIWFLHPMFCQITLFVYLINYVKYNLGILKEINREKWQQ